MRRLRPREREARDRYRNGRSEALGYPCSATCRGLRQTEFHLKIIIGRKEARLDHPATAGLFPQATEHQPRADAPRHPGIKRSGAQARNRAADAAGGYRTVSFDDFQLVAERQWLCRAVYPYAQGKPAVAADLRDYGGAAPSPARVPPDLQHHLADRTARLPHARAILSEAASNCCHRCVGFNPVSQKPQVVRPLVSSQAKR